MTKERHKELAGDRQYFRTQYGFQHFSKGETIVALMEKGYSREVAEKLVDRWSKEYGRKD